MAGRRQGLIWMLTIPSHEYVPYLPPGTRYVKGQLEQGEGGFIHWQILVHFARKQSLRSVRSVYGPFHAELSRSAAAEDYVWKEDTRVEGTQFELGVKPIRRNEPNDWDGIWESAKSGNIDAIPADVRIRCFFALRAIRSEFLVPVQREVEAWVFWGRSGTGKSRRAWEEAGLLGYPKDPRSKFWDGYGSQTNVVFDEFRGGIDISHVLRWLDRYPSRVEIKGSSVPLCATKFWFTSNLDPAFWWPDLDPDTFAAFRRRVHVVHFQ